MSWSTALQYGKAAIARHSPPSVARVDTGLPLGARIGSLMSLQVTPFIRANSAGGLTAIPERSAEIIQAISTVGIDVGGSVHRYYASTGDDETLPERFLQVFTDEHGDVKELLHCTQVARFIPQTEADQRAFTGEGDAGLGQKTFSLWRDQLAAMGVAEALLKSAFGDQPSIEYQRDCGGPDTEFVKPFEGVETRVDTSLGDKGLKQAIFYMPYARTLFDGSKECLIITTEILQEQDGTDQREIHVDFAIGVPVAQERVTIQ
jgi:hypothetical protein